MHTTSHSQPPGIKDTWLRRSLTLVAYNFFGHFARYRGSVLFISPWHCLKTREDVPLAEAWTLRHLHQHTSVPVPKVYCAFERKGRTYILMQRVRGEMLYFGWLQRSPESRATILAQLKALIEEIRTLDPPLKGPRVANIAGGPLWDGRCPMGATEWSGPFEDVDAFHRHIRRGFEGHPMADVAELIALQKSTDGDVCFTHGDLSSLNVMAQGDRITGIVDWQTAGWYPAYWEHGTAHCYLSPRNPWWVDDIDQFLETFPRELRMARLQQQYFGNLPWPH